VATSVTYELPIGNIEKIALRVTRRTGGTKYGELAIWQNEIGFKPTDFEHFFVVSWHDLATWIQQNGKKGKRKAAAVKHQQ
jgi:hypothetical protein